MKSNIIGYYLQGGVCCLDRPCSTISYSMIKISGNQKSLDKLSNIIPLGKTFEEVLLNNLKLNYKIID